MMKYKYQIISYASLERTRYWMNQWGYLGYKVARFEVERGLFGNPKRYLVVMECADPERIRSIF